LHAALKSPAALNSNLLGKAYKCQSIVFPNTVKPLTMQRLDLGS